MIIVVKCTFFFSFLILLLNGLSIRCNLFQKEEFSITSFEVVNRVDTIYNNNRAYLYKIDNYLVSGYEYTSENDKKIDQYVCLHRDTALTKYVEYFIYFFRRSSKTNNDYIKTHPREFLRHSERKDCLYEYKWRNSRFLHKEKQRRGSILESIENFNCE